MPEVEMREMGDPTPLPQRKKRDPSSANPLPTLEMDGPMEEEPEELDSHK